MPFHADQVVPFARAAAAGGHRLWIGQSLLVESHQMFAYLAGMGIKLPVGLGVTLMPLRHPFEAAAQARSLALLTGCPVVAGYGAATPQLVAALRGRPYRQPADAAAGYAQDVRQALDGGGNLRLPMAPHPPVEVGLGVLRPRMARAAGAVADVAITWLTPPAYVRDVLVPALAAGAAERPKPPRIATIVPVALRKPGRDPRRLALAAAGAHLRGPHYADMLRRAGIPADPAALVDSGLFAYGTADDIATCVRSYHEAGADEVILNVATGMEDLNEILEKT